MRPLQVAAVTLDAYGTLFEGGSDDLIKSLLDLHAEHKLPVPFENLLARREELIVELQQREFMNMRRRDEWILRTIFSEFGVDADPTPFVESLFRTYFAVKPYPDATACVDALKARGVKLAIVSNADVDMMRHVLQATGLLGIFDAVITSESAGAYKPAPAPFQSAARALGVPASGVLHVGDSFAADVVGAKRVGMRAAWLDRPGGLPAPKKREARPDFTIDSLSKLPTRVAPWP